VKNVTITLDEETAKWARIEAARRDTSVSRLVGELLREYMDTTSAYEASREEFFSRRPRALTKSGARYPRREDLHDRAALR
jgi:hypothetical protein